MKTNARPDDTRPFLGVARRTRALDCTYRRLVQLAPAWITILIALSGCAVEVHNVTPADVPSCTFIGEASGLKVSAEPFTEIGQLRRYFGDDVLAKGVLPVFVVFENQDAGDGFIMVQKQSALTTSRSSPESQTDAQVSHGTQGSGPPFTYSTSPVTDLTVGLLFGSIGQIALETHYTNLAIIARNLQEKRLVDKIVYPGSAHHGFMYYKVESSADAARIKSISFDARNVRTDEIVTMTTVMR